MRRSARRRTSGSGAIASTTPWKWRSAPRTSPNNAEDQPLVAWGRSGRWEPRAQVVIARGGLFGRDLARQLVVGLDDRSQQRVGASGGRSGAVVRGVAFRLALHVGAEA